MRARPAPKIAITRVSEVLLPVHFEPHPSSAHGLKMHCGLPQVLAECLTNSIIESP